LLRRKARSRYLSVLHSGRDADAVELLSRRCAELFGEITLEKAGLRLMSSNDGVIIVRCSLREMHAVLVSIALVDPPMLSLGMSGTISRLKQRARHSRVESKKPEPGVHSDISRFK
jgi:RNase P/RNase MRP subunit POP5